MEMPVIYVFTHDSIGVGEDGPTHQPIEQLASLRAIPGLIVAPARRRQRSGRGLAVIMQLQHEPVGLVLTPPGPADARPHQVRRGRRRGARAPTSWPTPPDGKPDVILIGTGSEVSLCVEPTSSSRPRASRPAWSACRRGSCSSKQDAGVPAQRAAAERDGARLGRAGVDVRLGALRRHDGAHASACTPSARRRRSRSCRRSSASRRTRSLPPPRSRSRGRERAESVSDAV